jgi:hypothetical protein
MVTSKGSRTSSPCARQKLPPFLPLPFQRSLTVEAGMGWAALITRASPRMNNNGEREVRTWKIGRLSALSWPSLSSSLRIKKEKTGSASLRLAVLESMMGLAIERDPIFIRISLGIA